MIQSTDMVESREEPVSQGFDLAPLTQAVSWGDIDAHANQTGLMYASRATRNKLIVASLIALAVTAMAAWLSATLPSIETAAVFHVVAMFTGIICVALVVAVIIMKPMYVKQVRMFRFAEANGLRYVREGAMRSHSGMIFSAGQGGMPTDVLCSAHGSGMDFETGKYQYTVGSGRSRQTYYWRYVWIGLERNLPHLVLDATRNNYGIFNFRISNLPNAPQKRQHVSLEGDFDKYFTLYAPEGYERDARYIFTPDLMALMIDKAHDFDAEVVDNGIYFYQRVSYAGYVAIPGPGFFENIHKIINVLGVKMNRRTDYYADERVGNRRNDVVAEQGRRLRKGISLRAMIAIGIIGFIVLTTVYSLITGNHTL